MCLATARQPSSLTPGVDVAWVWGKAKWVNDRRVRGTACIAVVHQAALAALLTACQSVLHFFSFLLTLHAIGS